MWSRALLLAVCSILVLAQPTMAERRVALVIGNGSYPSAPLKNPVNDAKDMATALQRLGFEVVLLTNANQQQMDTSVREFGIKLRQGGGGAVLLRWPWPPGWWGELPRTSQCQHPI